MAANKRLSRLTEHLKGEEISKRYEEDAEDSSWPPVIIGAAVLDIRAQPSRWELEAGGTVPGNVHQAPGGVGRNIAQALAQLTIGKRKPLLITAIGCDSQGLAIKEHWRSFGTDPNGLVEIEEMDTPTIIYTFNKDGSVASGVASVSQFEENMTPRLLQRFASWIYNPPLLVLDGNLPEATIQAVSQMISNRTLLFFEPVSTAKSLRALSILDRLDFASPNVQELMAMTNNLTQRSSNVYKTKKSLARDLPNGFEELSAYGQIRWLKERLLLLFKTGLKSILLTMGSKGAAVIQHAGNRHQEISVIFIPALEAKIRNTNGAGDCLVAGFSSGLLQKMSLARALALGIAAATYAIKDELNVPPSLSSQTLQSQAAIAYSKLETWSL